MKQMFFFRLTGAFLLFCCAFASCKKQAAPEMVANQQQSEQYTIKGNAKAAWITEAFTTLQNRNKYPAIKAISWWHENFDSSYLQINTSPESLKAYQDGIKNPLYTDVLTFQGNKLAPDASHIYHAAFPDFGGTEDTVTSQRITSFEQLAGKKIAWAYFSSNWYSDIAFPGNSIQAIKNAGSVPFIRLMPRSDFYDEEGADPVYTMQKIINGEYDSKLASYATQIGQLGFPVLMEFGTEMNGQWFAWNGKYNGGGTTNKYGDPLLPDGPERFRDAYRHIIDIFRASQADNITWFFHVDAYGEPEKSWNSISNYYPGDNYIDWIGVSMYGAQTPSEEYIPFSTIMDDVYEQLTGLSNKPIAILEWAVTE